MRLLCTVAACTLALVACREEMPLCGDPAPPGLRVQYQVVDAATGEDWFASPGRTSPDSLRLLPSNQGPEQRAKRAGTRVLLGPVSTLPIYGGSVITQLLRFSATDVDTIITRFAFNTVQEDPCGYGPGVREIEVTYNGQTNTFFRATVPADSLTTSGYFGGRVVQLRKRR